MYIGDGLLLSIYTPFELFSSHQLVCCEPLLCALEKMKISHKSKHQVIEVINRRRLTEVMNTTRWQGLFIDLNKIEEILTYKVTYIDGSTWPDYNSGHSETPELVAIWGAFSSIEYLDIRTKIEIQRGKLINPEIVNVTGKVVTICRKNKVRISATENGLRAWGYFEHGKIPELF